MIFALCFILPICAVGERVLHAKEYRQLKRTEERTLRAKACKKLLVKRLKEGKPPEWMVRQIKKDLQRPISQEGLDLTMTLESQGANLELVRFIIKNNQIKTEVNRP